MGDVIFPVVLFAGCWALGRFGRGRAHLTAELRARTEQLERERTERERDAVARERVRIARELHDVVAHSVSVMVVQAGAARSVLDRDPEASVRALGAVEDTGREALTEMRRLLGILRPDGEDADHSPQPSLDRLGALIARSRDAGLDVELRVEGRAGPLAPGVDLTAFRLVQEGLTNALKHGGRGRARVVLRWSAEVLEVEVANRITDGPAAARPRERRAGADRHARARRAVRRRAARGPDRARLRRARAAAARARLQLASARSCLTASVRPGEVGAALPRHRARQVGEALHRVGMGLHEALDGVLDRRAGRVVERLAGQLAARAPEVVAQGLQAPSAASACSPAARRAAASIQAICTRSSSRTKAMPASSTLRPTDAAAAMTSGA